MKFHNRFKDRILKSEQTAAIRDNQEARVNGRFRVENLKGVGYAEAGLKKIQPCIIDRSSVKTESNLYVNESLQEFAKMVGFDSFDDALEYLTVDMGKTLPYVGILHEFQVLKQYR